MKTFELWLDESGDFHNDLKKADVGANPSLIGGVLVENHTFPDSYINAILPEPGTYHSVNEKDQLDRFKLIEEKLYKNDNNRMVVFSNQECIMILDNNLTYLNIISEGIIQMIKHLKAQFGEIYINIIIANRVDTTTGRRPENSLVPSKEYFKRLREKILIAGLEHKISDQEWNLRTASARKDKRLMLADIICNTFFTRCKKKKFNKNEREYIEKIYNDTDRTLVFTVLESLIEKSFKDHLLSNRIGEAVASVCLSNDKEQLERCFSVLKGNFNSRGLYDISFQYRFISAYIEYYINVVRDFDLCLLFLNNLLDYYIPLLSKYDAAHGGDCSSKLTLDIKFYMLTVYTHLGDIVNTKRLESECDSEIKQLPASLESISYGIRYDVRKVNGLINAFDYTPALTVADELVDKCRDVKELLGLLSDKDKIFYEDLGKALGTRLQIKTFMLRFNKEYYKSAVDDSNEAIENFSSSDGKERQYLYRAQLETEYGDFDKALSFLELAVGLSEGAQIKDIWIESERKSKFAISSYIRLMSEGKRNKWPLADEMSVPVNREKYMEKIYQNGRYYHPDEIILWKYASYCSNSGMDHAAVKHYERAAETCFSTNDLTINIIGMAIDFEYHSFLLKNNRNETSSHFRNMQKRWKKILDADKSDILIHVFGEMDFRSKEAEYFADASRKMTY